MKKKLLTSVLAGVMTAVCAIGASTALCACGGGDGKGEGGNNSGITENTVIESIVSEKIATAQAWEAAFDFSDVSSLSCRHIDYGYANNEYVGEYVAKLDYKDSKGYLFKAEQQGDAYINEQHGYLYIDGNTMYCIYKEDNSKWIRQSRDLPNSKVCALAYIFDPIYNYFYKIGYKDKFDQFTYDDEKNGYVYANDEEAPYFEEQCVIKFYGGKVASLTYTYNDRSNPIIPRSTKEEILIYNIGGNQKVDIPTDYVDAEN